MSHSPAPNTLQDFLERFDELQKEAQGYGIESIVIIADQDPIGLETTKKSSRRCCPFRGLGLLDHARLLILKDLDC